DALPISLLKLLKVSRSTSNGWRQMKRSRSKLKLAHATDLPWRQIEFNSCLLRAREIEAEILAACEKHHFNEADLFAMKLALEEALVNAVKHGNKLDKCKKV